MEKDLKDLLIDELHDILSCEEQIVEALPVMVKAADSTTLKEAFQSHLKETKGQIQRLEKIFKLLKIEKKEKFCKATKGLIQECQEVLKDFKLKSPVRDAALISKAQRIEHYEISAYGTVRTFATEMNLDEVADLLQETLDEEGSANKKLSKIAEGGLLKSGINHQAVTLQNNSPSTLNKLVNTFKKSKEAVSKTKEAVSKTKDALSKKAPSKKPASKDVGVHKKAASNKTTVKKPASKEVASKKAASKKVTSKH